MFNNSILVHTSWPKAKNKVSDVIQSSREVCRESISAHGLNIRELLLFGRMFRTEDSSVRKSLPHRRLYRTEDSSIRTTLARVLRTKGSSIRKSLAYGRVFLAETSSVQKTLTHGRVLRTEHSSVLS